MAMNDGFLDESSFFQFNDDANASLTESVSVIAREREVGEEENQVSEYVIDSFCVLDSDCEAEKLPSDDVSCRLDASENEAPETVLRKRLPPRSARPSQPMCSSPQEPQRTSLIRTKQLSFNSSVDDSTNDKLMLKDLYPELNSKDASELLKEHSRYSSSMSNCSEESEDDDKAFEKYLQTLRTPIANPSIKRPVNVRQKSLSSFVVNDSDATDDASSPWTSNQHMLVHETIGDSDSPRKLNSSGDKEHSSLLILDTVRRRRHIRKGKTKKTVTVMTEDSWSDTESDEEKKVAEADFSRDASSTASFEQTFLRSLSPSCPDYQRHSDAKQFIGKLFKKNKTDLCSRLYRIFNEKIFALKLPVDLPLQWNVRLRKTSGRCCYRRSDGVRTARIELSTKVCDSADRVRDTLIHEMCHAAVWLIDGDMNGGHGPNWRLWANHACCIFPSLPMISRCHAYEIKAKFVYQCGQCKQEIKRHSKSVDIERKVCGYCRGRFSLLINGKPATAQTPKTNKFAQFVKNNYCVVKTASKSHKDVMAELGEQFKTLASI